ncbi:unnamed protein product [Parascedosporium putredinis]|uniref:BHLH domain-containing protein n=1 Tax=Parascedosporium putredinis TaxID=1442378 RepID=A0A9P1H7E8_9PEZI|nr:unnamed protein product [Parascedosporium putredinis]CAI7998452.1 unnamed protein product [Parascedosporium putredinis]
MMDSSGWNPQDQSMASATDDDFQQFLEMQGMSTMTDTLNFDFQSFQDPSTASMLSQAPRDQMDTSMGGTEPSLVIPTTAGLSQEHIAAITSGASHNSIQAHISHMPPTPNDAITEIDAQIQYLQQQRLQQQQRQAREQHSTFLVAGIMSFPDPQSLELQAGSGQFFSPLETPMFDNRPHHLKDAQQECLLRPPQMQQPVMNTTSPVEMDLETALPMSEAAKKARKPASKTNRKVNVRQSPITKPQRRKTTSSAIVNQVLNEAVENRHTSSPIVLANPLEDTDENSSVSPEALSDMPPPPTPPKVSAQTRALAANKRTNLATPLPLAAMPSPATPASLMKLPPSSSSNANKVSSSPNSHRGYVSTDPMDTFFQLPEAAWDSVSQPKSNVGAWCFHARVPADAAARPPREQEAYGLCDGLPALLPKISPNLKPLLPGASDETLEDTASRLLATKSNYQNILEGNKVPGVSYPSELSTNLTSKRTSHKIAEQGRRNRINSALQEIASLLPSGSAKSSDEGDAEKKDAKGVTPGSKASTVELAIEYIKHLKREVAEATKRAEDAERKLGIKPSPDAESLKEPPSPKQIQTTSETTTATSTEVTETEKAKAT